MKDPNHYANIYNAYEKNPKKIRVLDSTLREGEQHPGVSFTNKQRIQIAWMLDYFGVDQIEISPVVSKDHQEATKTIIKQGLTADIVSHGRALKQFTIRGAIALGPRAADINLPIMCSAQRQCENWAQTIGPSAIPINDSSPVPKEMSLEDIAKVSIK